MLCRNNLSAENNANKTAIENCFAYIFYIVKNYFNIPDESVAWF